MFRKHSDSIHYQTIFQWFLRIFLIVSLVFCFALIPLFVSMKGSFTDLQIEKRKQMLHTGTGLISNTAEGILNTSAALLSDSRFIQLRYKNIDYNDITITTQNQLLETFEDLIYPYNNVLSHTALQLNREATITDNTVFFKNQLDYYPHFFQVNDMDYEEWVNYLSEIGTGFSSVCHIKTFSSEYDAIIFATPWANSSYLYTCIDVSDIKSLILEENNLNNCYFTINDANGNELYSDLPENVTKYQTFCDGVTPGQLKISVHIPNNIFYQNMKPFYLFFAIYVVACILLLVSVNIFGTKRAAKPIMNIIELLEQSQHINSTGNILSPQRPLDGFDYISSSIIRADQNIGQYQNTLRTQHKVLQARFFEKAISGQLVSQKDIQDFHVHFPDFPENYCLLLVRLWTYTNGNGATLYSEPLLLIQTFLETQLAHVYQQQINDTELLLVLSSEDYENSFETLNFMISNINQEEPTYHACCIASNFHNNLESLPTAYQQIRALDGLALSDYQTHVCTAYDYVSDNKIPVTMIDLMTLYTAITSGNVELAMNRLLSYSNELLIPENVSFTKPVFEVIKSMLTYIRVDYSQFLIEQHIPSYKHGSTLYDQLADSVNAFCNLIGEYNDVNKDSFTQDLFNYIDAHYTDCDICLTSLKTHFKCSESTIRKVFKRVTDVPIARYIEHKRMVLANELLAQNEKSVTEIALECGYSLPHSFYKAYKRVYGHAPTLPNGMRGEINENDL